MAHITRAQRRLINEIALITDELDLDPHSLIDEFEGHPYLTTFLAQARRQLIAAAIVQKYTFLDELTGSVVAKYFFGAPGGRRLWRTKRFQRFNYFILERMSLLQKFALVRDIHRVPRPVVSYVEKVNDLRNAVAHSFFPENLRGGRTRYQGVDVFTVDGFMALRDAREPAIAFLHARAFGSDSW